MTFKRKMKSFEDRLVISNICPPPGTLIMRPNRALRFCALCLNCQSGFVHLKTRTFSRLQFNIHQKIEFAFLLVFSYRTKLWSARNFPGSAGSDASDRVKKGICRINLVFLIYSTLVFYTGTQ